MRSVPEAEVTHDRDFIVSLRAVAKLIEPKSAKVAHMLNLAAARIEQLQSAIPQENIVKPVSGDQPVPPPGARNGN